MSLWRILHYNVFLGGLMFQPNRYINFDTIFLIIPFPTFT